MKQTRLMILPALALAALSAMPAQASQATSIKDVTVGGRQLVELTNTGTTALKIVARSGADHASEATPTDNGIVEAYVAPGRTVQVSGPYSVYEYSPTSPVLNDNSYIAGS